MKKIEKESIKFFVDRVNEILNVCRYEVRDRRKSTKEIELDLFVFLHYCENGAERWSTHEIRFVSYVPEFRTNAQVDSYIESLLEGETKTVGLTAFNRYGLTQVNRYREFATLYTEKLRVHELKLSLEKALPEALPSSKPRKI
ncbi:hypothetical protein [Pseudomonas sp.]|uniref:hypothetical protein n=1 Tax=Pseudomonas sp. TaxID=306 RepID=UPI000FB192DC